MRKYMNSETFEIWQINLTDEQIEEVNSSDDMPEFFKKYTRTTFAPDVEDIYTAMNDDMYEHVANITAMNKNHVFEIGNIGPEDRIERLAPMHSVSVGDVIVSKRDGATYYVDSAGFSRLFTNYFSTGPAGIGHDDWATPYESA